MIDEAYSQKAQMEIRLIGMVGAGKSTLINSLFLEDIQAKERIFHREVNKSSDSFGLRVKQELQQQFHPFFSVFIVDPYNSFNLIENPILSTVTSTNISDFERAYQSTFPDGHTFADDFAFTTPYPTLTVFEKACSTLCYPLGKYQEKIYWIFFLTLALLLVDYIEDLAYCISVLKRRNIQALRCQYIANQAHNRVSRSPAPQKKEPPVGGVKVGGEQHNFSRYVATMLYLKQKRRETSPTSSTGKYANYGREGPGLFHLKGHAQWPKTSFRLKMKTQVRSLMNWKKIKTQTKSLLDKNKTMHKLSPIQANLILRR